MKLIKALHLWKIAANTRLLIKNSNTLIPISVLSLTAITIWFGASFVSWQGNALLATSEKKIYAILFVGLIWLLKFLIFDFQANLPMQHQDKKINKQLLDLYYRFQGAIHFLSATKIFKQDKITNLNKLPWVILIGPSSAGKTSLLANSNINYILKKQIHDLNHITYSENCDWWITKEACIIDVPGNYLSALNPNLALTQNNLCKPIFWNYFLSLLKNKRGKSAINSLVIALPASTLMNQHDNKKFHQFLHNLFARIQELSQQFSSNISCQLIITKCDLISGFKEFFSEASKEDLMQSWGFTLNEVNSDKTAALFNIKFNALIKKINQQLITRIHQERNPMLRPYIKDFPLQVERLKKNLLDFFNHFTALKSNLQITAIHFTSALQPSDEDTIEIIDQVNHQARNLQILKEPALRSKSYFIKNLFAYGLTTKDQNITKNKTNAWEKKFAYITAISLVIISSLFLVKDFKQGIANTYAMQKNIADYRLKIAASNDTTERLFNTVSLLNLLQQPLNAKKPSLTLDYLLSFYSYQAKEKNNQAYQAALHSILVKEIKNYFEDYLLIPINRQTDSIYSALKVYLMLGNPEHFNANYIDKTLVNFLPKSISENEIKNLSIHLKNSFYSPWPKLSLNNKLIADTRKYLQTKPLVKLSYIILKNTNNNNNVNRIDLSSQFTQTPIFITKQSANSISTMFTTQSFKSIIDQETILAGQEAIMGNWILGINNNQQINPNLSNSLIEELRLTYVNHYIEAWENLLTNIRLAKPKDLNQIDNVIVNFISDNSSLLKLLTILHSNTYFEPIISSSQKLQSLGLLLDKNSSSNNLLYDIFNSLQSLHRYLQLILNAENQKKAAFEAVSSRMLSRGTPDAITQLRIIALKSPEPLKSWLDKIANYSWDLLMQESGRYLDISWKEQVYPYYKTDIANLYPFNSTSTQELGIANFSHFFGSQGIILNFYKQYLQRLVDTSTTDWHWKKMDAKSLPFSEDALRQIQLAMRIHQSFFPNNDNQPSIKFALQPYKFSQSIKAVKLNISDEQFIDANNEAEKNSHIISWPAKNNSNTTSIQLTMANQDIITHDYPGNWGWIKLINQSFESIISKKALLINLSFNEHPVKYILACNGKYNPYLSLNLRRFHLPEQLLDEKI